MSEVRDSPRWRHIVLWALFAVLVVVGVFTVLIPELEDDNPEGSATESDGTAESSEPAETEAGADS